MLTNTHELSDLAAATRAAAIRSGQRPSDAERRTLNAETRRIARSGEFRECADLLGDGFLDAMNGAV